MSRALSLASRGAGLVSPNPLVGAVVVREGRIVGQGYHLFESKDHAEVCALKRAGELAEGADLYVNLEPCCHQGRTPPCTERIMNAGIRRVFVAIADPNPLVSGAGIRRLESCGIEVRVGVLGREAAELNEKFFHFVAAETPFTLLKLALTLDGKIAARGGNSQWITGERARLYGHRLRYEFDAIAVGIETVLQDDPSLDVRWRKRNSITKIVFDSSLRTPPDARLFASADPVILFHSSQADRAQAADLSAHARLVEVPQREGGLDWPAVLKYLGGQKVTSLMIEGGSRMAASALRAGIVRKINFFYGPKIIGDRHLCGVGDLGIEQLPQAIQLRRLRIRRLPPDFLVLGYV